MPAYVDESARVSGAATCYVMAAVLVPPDRAAAVRSALRDALPRDRPRVHWHSERASFRLALARLVRALDVDAVVVATPVRERRWERARRRCLVRLVWEVAERGADGLVLERRESRQDAADRRVLAATVRGRMRYAFAVPTDEPLLWIADVIAGAAGIAIGDGDTRYLDLLGERVVLVTLP